MFRKSLVTTPRISGDCDQIWLGSGTTRRAGFGIFKRLWQTRGLENKMNFILRYQKFLCPKNLPLKFMHIYTDDQETFWLVFAFYFTSYCYNSRMHCRNLEYPNKTVWMFTRDENFRGNSFARND